VEKIERRAGTKEREMIIESMVASILAEIISRIYDKVSHKIPDITKEQVQQVLKNTYNIFLMRYNDYVSMGKDCFIFDEDNIKKFMESMNPANEFVKFADINSMCKTGNIKASDEEINFLIDTFYEEIKANIDLCFKLAEKDHFEEQKEIKTDVEELLTIVKGMVPGIDNKEDLEKTDIIKEAKKYAKKGFIIEYETIKSLLEKTIDERNKLKEELDKAREENEKTDYKQTLNKAEKYYFKFEYEEYRNTLDIIQIICSFMQIDSIVWDIMIKQ
jgi:hypothetical protein